MEFSECYVSIEANHPSSSKGEFFSKHNGWWTFNQSDCFKMMSLIKTTNQIALKAGVYILQEIWNYSMTMKNSSAGYYSCQVFSSFLKITSLLQGTVHRWLRENTKSWTIHDFSHKIWLSKNRHTSLFKHWTLNACISAITK